MKKSLVTFLTAVACVLLIPGSAMAVGTGSISGAITDATTGLPVAGAEACADSEVQYGCAVSNASGVYSISGLAPGQYKVSFGDEADGYIGQYYDEADGYWNADPVTVSSGATTSGIDAALEKAGSITGTVTEAGSGEPLAGIDVCAENLDSYSYSCETSGEDGTYTISGLRPGSYKVVFRGGWIEANTNS